MKKIQSPSQSNFLSTFQRPSLKDQPHQDGSFFELRQQMQSMHDKIKATTQIGNTLNGDIGYDHPSSFKMLDASANSVFENEHSKNGIQFGQSDKLLKQVSSKISVNDPFAQQEKFYHQQRNVPGHTQDCKNFDLESPQFLLSNKEKEQNKQENGSNFEANITSQIPSDHKKSESSEDLSSSQSQQKVKQNDKPQSTKKIQKLSSRYSQFEISTVQQGKILSLSQNPKLSVVSQNFVSSSRESSFSKMCNGILKFLRLKKELNNFDKGIRILDNILNNQLDATSRYIQKTIQFVSILKQKYSKRSFNSLQIEDINIIGDISCYLQPNNSTKSLTQTSQAYHRFSLKFFSLFEKIYNNVSELIPINLSMPTDLLIVIWDVIQIIITYIFLFLYSVQVFFDTDDFSQDYMVLYFKIILALTIFDILIKFNTCYFEKDQIIQSRSKIAVKYLTSSIFFTDVIGLSAIFLKLKYKDGEVSYNPNHDIFTYFENSLIFLLGNRLKEKRQRFDNIITLEESQKHFFRLFIQLINVVSVAHFACIAWYMLGVYEEVQGFQISWLSKLGIEQYTYYEKYIYSLYWSITTMTTVGYGDITASNSTEALFILLVMILFSCVFAYSINNIGFILQEIEKSSKKLNDNLSTIQRYLNRKNVDIQLKSRVRHYLNFLEQESKNRDKKQEDEIISILSNKLRNEITEQINTRILNKFHLFSSNFSSNIMKKIVFLMEEVLVSPNEIIFQEDDVEDQSIYFIQSGIIEIYSSKITKADGTNVVYSKLSMNQIFGEISFFSGLARTASARSVNLSTMYRIKRNDFINLLMTNEEDFERLKMMQEQIIFHSNLRCLFLQCYSCKQLGHLASHCPKTHKQFDRQFIVLKSNFSKFQERATDYGRMEKKSKLHTFMLVKDNKKICKKLKENCRNINTQTQILYGYENNEQEEEVEEQDHSQNHEEEEEQQSLSSAEESSRSQFDKVTASRVQSLSIPLKSQDNVMLRGGRAISAANESELQQDMHSKSHHIKSQTVINENSSVYQISNIYDELAFINNILPNKIEKQRLSQLENLTLPPSQRQLPQQQQGMPIESNLNYSEVRRQQVEFQNNIYDENIKHQRQDIANKHQSLQSLDQDIVSSQNNQLGSKKNLDLNINQINIPGASSRDQQSYFSQLNPQQKRSRDIPETTDYENSTAFPMKVNKRSSFNPNSQVLDGYSMQSFNNASVFEKTEKNDDIMIHNKQLSNKQLDGIKNKYKTTQFQQSTSNQMIVTAKTLGNSEKLGKLKTRQIIPEYEQEAIQKYNQQIQQNKEQSQFYLFQMSCLEQFDKVKIFKKFFPKNNIDRVIKGLKIIQLKQRKQKRQQQNKKRRTNVMLAFDMTTKQVIPLSAKNNKSIYNEDFITQKPTYYSYGVSMRNDNIYPKSFN